MNSEIRKPFPKPKDKVVLSDLDKTLITSRYQTTNDAIGAAISERQEEGWRVGLSSDTPHKALEVWHERFGMQGPIVAEKGAVVVLDSGLLYSKEDSEAFSVTRTDVERTLSDEGFLIWEGNPVEAIRDKAQIGSPGDKVVLVNGLRVCSMGLFFRGVDTQSQLVIDPLITHEAMAKITDHRPDFPVDEDFSEEHGLLIVARQGTSKRSGTQALMDHNEYKEIGMIGDSLADYLGDDIAKHYAVGNASSDYKDRADYTADAQYTDGVIEILSQLEK